MAYIPVVFVTIWIAMTAFQLIPACLSTNIMDEVCVPWGVYSSSAMEKALGFFLFFVAYLLPLAMMSFCYSRIVHSLTTKVTAIYYVSIQNSSANCDTYILNDFF